MNAIRRARSVCSGSAKRSFPLFCLVQLLAAASVGAQNCTPVEKHPHKVDKPGCYRLTDDLVLQDPSGKAITVAADDVDLDLDLNRKTLGGPSNARGSGAGVYAGGVKRLRIRNGTVKGFLYGIRIDGGSSGDLSNDVVITKMVAANNYFRGILVQAGNASIEDNEVHAFGGTLMFPDAFAIAIEVVGNRCRVARNTVSEVSATGVGEGIGISLSDARAGCVVLGNCIATSWKTKGTFGVWLSYQERSSIFIRDNRIAGFGHAFSYRKEQKAKAGGGGADVFENNLLENVGCTPKNFASHYAELPISNRFRNDKPLPCPVLVSSIERQHGSAGLDERSTFLLAMANYRCAQEPPPDRPSCCRMEKQAVVLLQKSAAMGLPEAVRALLGVENAVPQNPRCR